jgi:hypothetical protein
VWRGETKSERSERERERERERVIEIAVRSQGQEQSQSELVRKTNSGQFLHEVTGVSYT